MTRSKGVPTVGDRAFLLDASAIAVVSGAIVVAAHELLFMTLFVPTIMLVRLGLFGRLSRQERGWGLGFELALFAICVALGAFNDWSSVVRHQIYDYQVPVFFPAVTTIPLWMLLFWGMILRFFVSLFRWRRMGLPQRPRNDVWLGRTFRLPWAKIALQLCLVFATRQAIYRWYRDPWLSWLPFVAALAVFVVLFRPRKSEWRMILIVLAGGPLVEILYIQTAGLHRYHLGWLGGVPLWIALWWVVAISIWQDLSGRLLCAAAKRWARTAPRHAGEVIKPRLPLR